MDRDSVQDNRALVRAPTPSTDWSGVAEVCERRSWLLDEQPKVRINFDTLKHKDNCNVSPRYRADHPNAPHNCDCGALAEAIKAAEAGK